MSTQAPHATSQTTTSAGRRHALTVAAIVIGVELLVDLSYLLQIGPDRLLQQAIRLALATWLVWALLRRRSWARWTLMVLLVLGLAIGAVAVFQAQRPQPGSGVVFMGLIFSGYLTAALILMFSRNLREYVGTSEKPYV